MSTLVSNLLEFKERTGIALTLFKILMSKAQKPNYINSEIKKVSESDLKKALNKVNEKNKDIRDSFRVDKDTLAFRAGR